MVINIYEELQKFIDKDDLRLLLEQNSKPLPTTVRLNRNRLQEKEFEDLLDKYEVIWEKNPFLSYAYLLQIPTELGHKFIFKLRMLGLIYFQNFSSMIPPLTLGFHELEDYDKLKIIDTCASPGSKTTQLSQMMNNKGIILANDFSKKNHRAYILHRNLKLSGSINVVISMQDARKLGPKWPNYFDAALVDVPCTGSGVIREREIPKRFENDLNKMFERQTKILESAIQLVKPGGTIIYSTCSYLPQENELVLKRFVDNNSVKVEPISAQNLRFHKGLSWFEQELPKEMENASRIYPFDFNSVGFFVAKLRVQDKNGDQNFYDLTKNTQEKDKYLEEKWEFIEGNDKNRVWDNFSSNWGLKSENYSGFDLIRNRKGRIWITTNIVSNFLRKRRNWHPPERLAVAIAQEEKNNPNEIRLTIDGVLVFQSEINKQKKIILNKNLEEQWFQGQSIDLSELNPKYEENSYVILETEDGIGIGCSKFRNNQLYNFLPKFRQYPTASDKKTIEINKNFEFYSSVLEEIK
ncbi:MAG: RsmB/NOP family class I SAM-dependent RNA methyltransferase [Candidatus Hodarchaeales archaeon]|jgi:16S rRNA C967 or C1407 C5-methylase (RsmB/RsmF family)/NOL1/NOP2/fmu family ribosome biogenesis protein